MEEDEIVLTRAKKLYYKHLGCKEEQYPYLWGQCSTKYKDAWVAIAECEISDEILGE